MTEGTPSAHPTKDPRAVFVVHGRNDAARDAMFEFLRSIDLKPIAWTRAVELTGSGSPYIGAVLDAAFDHAQAVVVLMTPDEMAYLRPTYASRDDDPETQPAAQARPNVLFEAGMALGRDARRTVLVELGEVRPFSDVAGRHAVRLSNDAATRQALAKRLETAGCPVDLTGTDWHRAGDFIPPIPPGDGMPLGRRVPSARGRPRIDFDVKYLDRGSRRTGKLQLINRGTETAYDIKLAVPEGVALDLQRADTIAKVPGNGRSVTIDAWSNNHYMGANAEEAFDIHITARTEDGYKHAQDVFIDMNG